ncbi:MAG TPA: NDP-sugar synthase [Myxococcaceae bacterium]|nr:NDP-sugar synthase [Myxococcaceae bacterium]
MKAMILCAGLGTRLRPLTERWPKPAIPLLGVPLFRYHLSVLRRAGVRAVGINTHHLPEEMERCAGAECSRLGLPLEVVREPVIQGTGGGIRGLRGFLGDAPFVVFNGDILFPLDLGAVVAEHKASGAAATMVLLPMPREEKYAAVEMDASGTIRRIAGHGPGGDRLSPWHFSGVHVMNPDVFDFMSKEGAEDINREVYPRLMAKGLRLRGHVVDAYWSDLGTPSRYLAAQRDLLFGQVPQDALLDATPLRPEARGPGNYWLANGARVDGGVSGPAHFDGCVVEPGAKVGSAVFVGQGARVAPGARLNRVAVFEGTQVSDGEELVEAIAWREHRISAPLPPSPGTPVTSNPA